MGKKKIEEPAVETNPDDKIFRLLSAVLLISSDQFARQSVTKQTSIIALATPTQPVRFVPDFLDLMNIKRLRDRMLDGKDVEHELEFNGIEFTAEERAAMQAFLPVLTKLNAKVPAYPWLNPAEEFACFELTSNGRKIRRNGHAIGVKTAMSVWERASKYWTGGKKPQSYHIGSNYYSRGHNVVITETQVSIGCQTIPRAEVEYLARWQNWKPVLG